jgi:hypothetical protein
MTLDSGGNDGGESSAIVSTVKGTVSAAANGTSLSEHSTT